VKYRRASIGYVISVLIKEEDYYKSQSLKVVSRALQKPNGPCHLNDINLKMPIDFALKQILSIFTKAEQQRITRTSDWEELNKLTTLTLGALKDCMDAIFTSVLERPH